MERLTIKERQVIETFWHNDQSLSVSDVSLLLPNESKNTIAAVTNKLLIKGWITVDKVDMSGTVLVRKFTPTISEATYYVSTVPSTTIANVASQHIQQTTDIDYLTYLEKRIQDRRLNS